MRFRICVVPSLYAVLLGCSPGATLGEKSAGADTYLGFGDIGVDDRTETSFALSRHTYDGGAPPVALLGAVRSGATTSQTVEDLSGRQDLRVLFPASGVLVMSEGQSDQLDRLDLFDKDSLASIRTSQATVRYHGTRMSPSRRWVGVADNTDDHAPIHIVNAETLETTIVPHGGDWLEAMWLHNSDELVSIVFYDMYKPTAHARVLSWKMETVEAGGFTPDSSGFWPDPHLDIDVPGASPEFFFSFTWVGINTDDSQAVLPVLMPGEEADGGSAGDGTLTDAGTRPRWKHTLLVVDVATGTLRQVDDARGPVGFTPDGKTIVSYGASELKLIDAATLTVTPEPVSIEGGLSYFVSHEGNLVVVGSATGKDRLVLVDLDHNTQTQMAAPGVRLDEFVSRLGHNELWIVDKGSLFRMDLAAGEFETVPTDFSPGTINILSRADRLVFNPLGDNKLVFFDPNTRQSTSRVALP